MDEDENIKGRDEMTTTQDDLDNCCDCEICKRIRAKKDKPEPTPQERTDAFQRLYSAAFGAKPGDALRHAAESLFRQYQRKTNPLVTHAWSQPPSEFQKAVDEQLEKLRKGAKFSYQEPEDWSPFGPSKVPVPKPRVMALSTAPDTSKEQFTLNIFEQLESLINDGGWCDEHDKAIALLRLKECRILYEQDCAYTKDKDNA